MSARVTSIIMDLENAIMDLELLDDIGSSYVEDENGEVAVQVTRRLLWDVLDELRLHNISGPILDRVEAAVWGDADA